MKLSGATAPAGTKLVHVEAAFRSGISPIWVILAILGLGAAVVWMYQRAAEHVPPARRWALMGLRIGFLALLLLILLRPVLALTVEETKRRVLLILCDATMSMQLADPRGDSPADLKRAAIARGELDPKGGLDQELSPAQAEDAREVTRLELMQSVLKNPRLKLLERLGHEYDLRMYTVGADGKGGSLTDVTPPVVPEPGADQKADTDAQPLPTDLPRGMSYDWVDRLTATSPVTPLGDALQQAIALNRGQALAGMVIMTDGGNNSGSDPLLVAQGVRKNDDEIPFYPYGIGMSSPRDIIVAGLYGPETCFAREEVGVTVRVGWQNLAGQSAKLNLMLGDEVVDTRQVTFGADGEQVVAMKFSPQKPGDYELKARIDPHADEVNKDNNEVRQHLRVIDGRIKVLMVEQSPRWEFKYLMAQLMRDRRVDFKAYLIEADPGLSVGDQTPYLAKFPQGKEELLKYDLIILGDVDPAKLTQAQMENMAEFVAKFGGGFLMIAGKVNAPARYAGTAIEKMLPVELMAAGAAQQDAGSESANDRPIRLMLTDQGKRSRMLQLSGDPQENATRWEQLPPIYWDARVSRAKPAAEVLLADPDAAKASRFGPMPVVAIQQYGLGQVVYVGTDNTWRWRKNRGDQDYWTLWGQVMQRLSLPHLLGVAKRTQLNSDKRTYAAGERVTVYARLYNENYEPVAEKTVTGYLQGASGEPRAIVLRPEPTQPGQYRAEFLAPAAGSYRFHVDKPGDPKVELAFTVTEQSAEMGQTAMNETLLRAMAATTGGQFFREEDLDKLPDSIGPKTEVIRSTLETELWDSPLYFLTLLGLVTAEWILRKMSQLK